MQKGSPVSPRPGAHDPRERSLPLFLGIPPVTSPVVGTSCPSKPDVEGGLSAKPIPHPHAPGSSPRNPSAKSSAPFAAPRFDPAISWNFRGAATPRSPREFPPRRPEKNWKSTHCRRSFLKKTPIRHRRNFPKIRKNFLAVPARNRFSTHETCGNAEFLRGRKTPHSPSPRPRPNLKPTD